MIWGMGDAFNIYIDRNFFQGSVIARLTDKFEKPSWRKAFCEQI